MPTSLALFPRFTLRSTRSTSDRGRRWARHGWGTAAALAAALLTAAPATPALAAEAPQVEAPQVEAPTELQTREVVGLELRIAAEGRAVGRIDQLVELDTDTALALHADGHEHAVDISVRKVDEDGHTLAVTLGYRRDGEAVLETMTIEAAAKEAQIVRSEVGRVALSLTLSPTQVAAEELPTPEPSRPRVEIVEDTNDPLAGI